MCTDYAYMLHLFVYITHIAAWLAVGCCVRVGLTWQSIQKDSLVLEWPELPDPTPIIKKVTIATSNCTCIQLAASHRGARATAAPFCLAQERRIRFSPGRGYWIAFGEQEASPNSAYLHRYADAIYMHSPAPEGAFPSECWEWPGCSSEECPLL